MFHFTFLSAAVNAVVAGSFQQFVVRDCRLELQQVFLVLRVVLGSGGIGTGKGRNGILRLPKAAAPFPEVIRDQYEKTYSLAGATTYTYSSGSIPVFLTLWRVAGGI